MGFAREIAERLGIPYREPDLSSWEGFVKTRKPVQKG